MENEPADFDENTIDFWLESLGPISQADANAAVTWWKALREEDLRFWFSAGLAAKPADAWTFYKTATEAPAAGESLPGVSHGPDASQA